MHLPERNILRYNLFFLFCLLPDRRYSEYRAFYLHSLESRRHSHQYSALMGIPAIWIRNRPAIYYSGTGLANFNFVIQRSCGYDNVANLPVLGIAWQQSATKIYRNFLFKDYLSHKTENYTKKIAVVATQVPRFVYMLFQPFLLLTSQLFIVMLILVGLLVLDPLLAFIAGGIIGGSYLATYIVLRKRLAYHGAVISEKNNRVQGILSESFIGIKDVKLDSLENRYIDRFNTINVRGLKSQAFIALAGDLPKFVIESISFGAILVLALVLLTTQDDIRSVVPLLSIYALAGYKLLPTMQQIYKSLSSLSGHGSVANIIKNRLKSASTDPLKVLNKRNQ